MIGRRIQMLKPIDLQSMLPHSLNVQRIQELQNNRTVVEQQQFSKELLQQVQTRQNQVPKNEATIRNNQIRNNESNEGRKRQLKYRRTLQKNEDSKEKAEETTKPKKLDEQRGNHIDVKV